MPINVFIADDHKVLRDGLCALLEVETNIIVVGDASDGREALKMIQKLCPDVVIMDIAMPKLNGIDATALLLETCPLTKVVILSMYSNREYVFRALRAGAHGYILKDSAGQEVVKAVRTVHSGARYLNKTISDMIIEDYTTQQRTLYQNPLDLLSSREREVLQLVVEGSTSAEIADTLNISPKTAETYRSRIKQKLDIRNLPELVKFAIRSGITTVLDK